MEQKLGPILSKAIVRLVEVKFWLNRHDPLVGATRLQTVHALDALHRKGLVHRSPQGVYVPTQYGVNLASHYEEEINAA